MIISYLYMIIHIICFKYVYTTTRAPAFVSSITRENLRCVIILKVWTTADRGWEVEGWGKLTMLAKKWEKGCMILRDKIPWGLILLRPIT